MGDVMLSRDSRDFPRREYRELPNFSRDSRSSYIAAGAAGTGKGRNGLTGWRCIAACLLGTKLTRGNDD